MIKVSTVIDICNSQLDAEGSERYLFDNDFKPAINYAQQWLVSIFNSVFSQNKLSEENLRELMRVRCWKASSYSRINFDEIEVDDDLWTIVAVYPNCVYTPIQTLTASTTSVYYPNVSFLSGTKSAKRISLEEFARAKVNPFEAGNTIVTATDLIDYAYVNFADYNGAYISSSAEIEISPSVATKMCGIAYLKLPSEIDDINDDIEFPASLTNMIVKGVLNFIAVKQGDGTNLFGVTQKEEKELITLMS